MIDAASAAPSGAFEPAEAYASQVDDDLLGAAAQPHCPACRVIMREDAGHYVCPACGLRDPIPPVDHPGDGRGLIEFPL